MKQTMKKYDAKSKAKVVFEALKERETLNELAAKYELSPVMISRWEKGVPLELSRGFRNPEEQGQYSEAVQDPWLEPAQLARYVKLHRGTQKSHFKAWNTGNNQLRFTSKEWADAWAQHSEMKVSMDGRGRAKDNIWIERFWKTARICSLESRDLLTITTTTIVTKESTVQHQASATFVRQLGLN